MVGQLKFTVDPKSEEEQKHSLRYALEQKISEEKRKQFFEGFLLKLIGIFEP